MKSSHEKALTKASKANVKEHNTRGKYFTSGSMHKNVEEHNIRMKKYHKPKPAN